MARLLRFAAAVALGGLATAGLTACTGGGSDASPSPTPVVTVTEDTASPSPTPTLTPEEELLAQIPEDARGESFPEAINFSRFFLELYGPLFHRDYPTSMFEFLCDDANANCEDALSNVSVAKSVEGYCAGGDITFDNAEPTGGQNQDGFMYVSQRFEVSAQECFNADGTAHSTTPAGAGVVGLKLLHSDGRWHVVGTEFAYDDE